MKYAVGCLAMAAALVGGPAQAVQVVGESQWSFSRALVAALNVGTNSLSEITPGDIVSGRAYFGSSVLTVPVSGVDYDASSLGLSAVQTSGGLTITSANVLYVALGGSIDITDLKVDLGSNRVYATLRGDFSGVPAYKAGQGDPNRVETIQDFHLFDYSVLEGSTVLELGGETSFTVSGLTITNSGLGHFISALRLAEFGTAAFSSVRDYGFITTSISAVPEPSTYGLALLGGAIVTVVTRARWVKRPG